MMYWYGLFTTENPYQDIINLIKLEILTHMNIYINLKKLKIIRNNELWSPAAKIVCKWLEEGSADQNAIKKFDLNLSF